MTTFSVLERFEIVVLRQQSLLSVRRTVLVWTMTVRASSKYRLDETFLISYLVFAAVLDAFLDTAFVAASSDLFVFS